MTKQKLTKLSKEFAKNIWIDHQKLNRKNPFGSKSEAVAKAVEHLGYVQIDTINVIERCHHHILFNRIPNYKKNDLEKAQSKDKTIFEYWTHALSYVPTSKFKYFVSRMNNVNTKKGSWFGAVSKEDYKKVMRLLEEGPLSVRDIKDDNLKEKEHEWDSRKPSKRALQLGFHRGDIVVAKREGMLKIYDLTSRHFGWETKPEAVLENEYFNYLIDRSLQSQGIVSLDSICHLYPSLKKNIEPLIEQRVKQNLLVPVQLEDHSKVSLWLKPEALEKKPKGSELTHILSPFDPLIIQRRKLKMFFDYDHVFEAYVTPAKRKFGYFTLPVLSENRIIALLDLKTDRQNQKLLIQSWHWLNSEKTKNNKKIIEEKLESFEKFQLG